MLYKKFKIRRTLDFFSWKLSEVVRKEQMAKMCSCHGHSHTKTTPNEAFSNTQVPCRANYYQTPPSPQDRVH